jgi:hypothetical protein
MRSAALVPWRLFRQTPCGPRVTSSMPRSIAFHIHSAAFGWMPWPRRYRIASQP